MKKNCTYNITRISMMLDGDKTRMLGLQPVYRNIPTIEEAELLQKYAYIKRNDSSIYAIIPNDINITDMGNNHDLVLELAEKYKSKVEVSRISADTRKENKTYKVIRITEKDVIHEITSPQLSLEEARRVANSVYPGKDYIAVVPSDLNTNDKSIMENLIDRMSKGKGQHFVFENV